MKPQNLIERLDYQPKAHWMAIPALISAAAAIGSSFINKSAAKDQAKAAAGANPTAPAGPPAAATSAVAPNITGGTPGVTNTPFKTQEQDYWNNLLTGVAPHGAVQPEGGGLPTGVQENIDRQASLIGPGQ